MPLVGVADYGLMVWEGTLVDYEERVQNALSVGFDGLERLRPSSASDGMEMAARVRRLGASFATVLAPNLDQSIRWTAALGKEYVWVKADEQNFDQFCRQVNLQTKAAARYGIKAAYHFHSGPAIHSLNQFQAFMEACPDVHLILDTANHFLADMDPLHILDSYYSRLAAVHLKDWVVDASMPKGGRTCVLGQGNIAFDLHNFLRKLLDKGYDKWVFVEPEHFQTDPWAELKQCREFVAQVGI